MKYININNLTDYTNIINQGDNKYNNDIIYLKIECNNYNLCSAITFLPKRLLCLKISYNIIVEYVYLDVAERNRFMQYIDNEQIYMKKKKNNTNNKKNNKDNKKAKYIRFKNRVCCSACRKKIDAYMNNPLFKITICKYTQQEIKIKICLNRYLKYMIYNKIFIPFEIYNYIYDNFRYDFNIIV